MKFLGVFVGLGVFESVSAVCPLSFSAASSLASTMRTEWDFLECSYKAATGTMTPDAFCGPCKNALDLALASVEPEPQEATFSDCTSLSPLAVGKTIDTIFEETGPVCAANMVENACFLSTVGYDTSAGLTFDATDCETSVRAYACEAREGRCGAKTIECGATTKQLYTDTLYGFFSSCSANVTSTDCSEKALALFGLFKKTVDDIADSLNPSGSTCTSADLDATNGQYKSCTNDLNADQQCPNIEVFVQCVLANCQPATDIHNDCTATANALSCDASLCSGLDPTTDTSDAASVTDVIDSVLVRGKCVFEGFDAAKANILADLQAQFADEWTTEFAAIAASLMAGASPSTWEGYTLAFQLANSMAVGGVDQMLADYEAVQGEPLNATALQQASDEQFAAVEAAEAADSRESSGVVAAPRLAGVCALILATLFFSRN